MRTVDVFVAFMVGAAQLSLFAWPIHVLDPSQGVDGRFASLRLWLLFFAAFALAGPLASLSAASARRAEHFGPALKPFEERQRKDRRSGFGRLHGSNDLLATQLPMDGSVGIFRGGSCSLQLDGCNVVSGADGKDCARPYSIRRTACDSRSERGGLQPNCRVGRRCRLIANLAGEQGRGAGSAPTEPS
jgi:hypothetical protein